MSQPQIKPIKLDGVVYARQEGYNYLMSFCGREIPPFKHFYLNTADQYGNPIKGALCDPLRARLTPIDGEGMRFKIQYTGYYWDMPDLELAEGCGVICQQD